MISVSVVSHNHGDMVAGVVNQLLAFPEVSQVIVTLNVPEPWLMPENVRVQVIHNAAPKGFGANHNEACRFAAEGHYFCVLNPDVGLPENPFPALLRCFEQSGASVVAPAIINPAGGQEDSARYFPTIFSLFKKFLKLNDGRYSYTLGQPAFDVDWVAGMFMLFKPRAFADLAGFDEGYFLYYEDVDLCFRARKAGKRVVLCPESVAIHDARRTSHKNIRYMYWHLSSMARFLLMSSVGARSGSRQV